jgi:hypothetical protein
VDTVCPISVFEGVWPSSVVSAALESKYSLNEGMVDRYEPKIPSDKLITRNQKGKKRAATFPNFE